MRYRLYSLSTTMRKAAAAAPPSTRWEQHKRRSGVSEPFELFVSCRDARAAVFLNLPRNGRTSDPYIESPTLENSLTGSNTESDLTELPKAISSLTPHTPPNSPARTLGQPPLRLHHHRSQPSIPHMVPSCLAIEQDRLPLRFHLHSSRQDRQD